MKIGDNTPLLNDDNPESDLHIDPQADVDQEYGSRFDWVNWPSNIWIDTDDQGNDRVIDLPERSYANKVQEMLRTDGTAAQVFEALTLPILSANWELTTPKGDTGQAELVRDNLMRPGVEGGMSTPWEAFMAQMTMATAVKRSYHEKVWHRDPEDGKVKYTKLAWRPPGACELIRDIGSGEVLGFRQYMDFGLKMKASTRRDMITKDGYVEIPARRAVVYIHGQRIDPTDGASSMEVTYNCWQLKQKVLDLWFTFLGATALPRVIAYGADSTQANNNARQIAQLKSAGVIGMVRPDDPTQKIWDMLDTSGATGSAEFANMVAYLDSAMTHSILAGFLELTRQAVAQRGTGSARGSAALNESAQDMYMQSRWAVAKEMAETINSQVIGPMVWANYGLDAPVPQFKINQINSDQAQEAVALLTALSTSQTLQVPNGFIELLVEKAASYLGIDEQKIASLVAGQVQQVSRTGSPGVPTEAPPLNGSAPSHPAHVNAAVDTINKMIGSAKPGTNQGS